MGVANMSASWPATGLSCSCIDGTWSTITGRSEDDLARMRSRLNLSVTGEVEEG